MGKTSVNTACRPAFLRLRCGASSCRNSRYELVCNSIGFKPQFSVVLSLISQSFASSLSSVAINQLRFLRTSANHEFLFHCSRDAPIGGRPCRKEQSYLTSTFAPASSSFFLALSV